MAWSTREIAQLAGTTVRAVRHHHEIGLLDEPRRRTNGYKQYGVAHLVRALRIKRLTDLGFSLPQIAEMGDTDRHPRQALRRLDTELAETLERVRRVRADLRQILSQAAPTDLPVELAAAICDMDLSDADRSLLVVMSRVLEPTLLRAFAASVQTLVTSPAGSAFDNLPADADEPTRQDLAMRLLPLTLDLRPILPGRLDADADPGAVAAAARTIDAAVGDLYSPAQVDVLHRIRRLRRTRRPGPSPSGPTPPPNSSPGRAASSGSGPSDEGNRRNAAGPARSIPMIIVWEGHHAHLRQDADRRGTRVPLASPAGVPGLDRNHAGARTSDTPERNSAQHAVRSIAVPEHT
jgi:DNA-binding transcriptional MerR regulator